MKIVITGSEGRLGLEFSHYFSKISKKNLKIFTFSHKQLDILDKDNLYKTFKEINPDILINCAAYTKVSEAEKNFKKAFLVNVVGVENLVELCNDFDCLFIHFSTDYVFDGKIEIEKEGYTEFDKPNPLNKYGLTKLEGENIVLKKAERFYLFRVAWLYGRKFDFVKFVLENEAKELKIIIDQFGSPTWTYNVVNKVWKILEKGDLPYGLYHLVCNGGTSWFIWALKILEIAKVKKKIVPILSAKLGGREKRPRYTVLLNYKLEIFNENDLPDWEHSLKNYLKSIF